MEQQAQVRSWVQVPSETPEQVRARDGVEGPQMVHKRGPSHEWFHADPTPLSALSLVPDEAALGTLSTSGYYSVPLVREVPEATWDRRITPAEYLWALQDHGVRREAEKWISHHEKAKAKQRAKQAAYRARKQA